MNGEAEWLFEEIQRDLFLARSEDCKNRNELLEEIDRNVGELRRLWEDKETEV